MRQVKSFDDVNLVLAQLMTEIERNRVRTLDFHKKRITNASKSKDASDYVIQDELPIIPGQEPNPSDFYTIIFSSSGVVLVGTSVAAPFIVTRPGIIYKAFIAAVIAPSGGPCTADSKLNGTSIFANLISLPSGSTGTIESSDFVTPRPRLAKKDKIVLDITAANDADRVNVSLQVLIK